MVLGLLDLLGVGGCGGGGSSWVLRGNGVVDGVRGVGGSVRRGGGLVGGVDGAVGRDGRLAGRARGLIRHGGLGVCID